MRGVVMKTILAAAIAGSSLLVATGANAHDRWDKWDRWERKHHSTTGSTRAATVRRRA